MVNTFLVHSDFSISASFLDSRRLGKQRVEAMQILNIIENIYFLAGASNLPYPEKFSDLKSYISSIDKWYKKQDFIYKITSDEKYLIKYPKNKYSIKTIPCKEDERIIKMGFCSHPAVRLWFGYEDALREYIDAHIKEWIKRGNKNTMKIYNVTAEHPPWTLNTEFHINHKSALFKKEVDRKERLWYGKFKDFVEAPPFIDYVWL